MATRIKPYMLPDPLPAPGSGTVTIPQGAVYLSLGMQYGRPVIFAKVNTLATPDAMHWWTFPTDDNFTPPEGSVFFGSIPLNGGTSFAHLYLR